VGPTMVGVLNDLLAPRFGDEAIRYSLLIVAATPVLAALCFLRAATLYAAANAASAEPGATSH